MTRRHVHYLKRAAFYAERSQCKQRHGALVLSSGRVVGVGHNKYRNPPADWIPPHEIAVHAEEAAIRAVPPSLLKGATIFVARVMPSGQIGLSKPCQRCQDLIDECGIKRVIYTR